MIDRLGRTAAVAGQPDRAAIEVAHAEMVERILDQPRIAVVVDRRNQHEGVGPRDQAVEPGDRPVRVVLRRAAQRRVEQRHGRVVQVEQLSRRAACRQHLVNPAGEPPAIGLPARAAGQDQDVERLGHGGKN
jgi:hypothetical protein